MSKNTITINGMEITYGTREELADIMAVMGMSTSAKGKGKSKKATEAKAPEKVEFVKKDGTVKMVSKAQARVWEEARNRSNGKTLDEVKAEWNAKHDAYKPSKELKDAIKADRASITLAVAKEQYGFVGTKAELKALKAKVLAK